VTKQEYYDLLVKSAFDGTFPGFDRERFECEYRSPDGCRKCAVGILMSDQFYRKSYEGNTVRYLVEKMKTDVSPILPDGMTYEDLQTVQKIHDSLAALNGWSGDWFVDRINTLSIFQDVQRSKHVK